ncbi:hypothetical protein [Streptomyces sp. NPDC054940]
MPDLVLPLPDVAPDEPHVSFAMVQCRQCDEQGQWARTTDDGADHAFDVDHQQATGHTHFYVWTITRATSRVIRL